MTTAASLATFPQEMVRLSTLKAVAWNPRTMSAAKRRQLRKSLLHFGLTVPIVATAPVGSTLVAEVMVPDGVSNMANFYIGANSSGQTSPSFRRSPDCDGAEPVDVADIGHASMHIVLEVTGVEML